MSGRPGTSPMRRAPRRQPPPSPAQAERGEDCAPATEQDLHPLGRHAGGRGKVGLGRGAPGQAGEGAQLHQRQDDLPVAEARDDVEDRPLPSRPGDGRRRPGKLMARALESAVKRPGPLDPAHGFLGGERLNSTGRHIRG